MGITTAFQVTCLDTQPALELQRSIPNDVTYADVQMAVSGLTSTNWIFSTNPSTSGKIYGTYGQDTLNDVAFVSGTDIRAWNGAAASAQVSTVLSRLSAASGLNLTNIVTEGNSPWMGTATGQDINADVTLKTPSTIKALIEKLGVALFGTTTLTWDGGAPTTTYSSFKLGVLIIRFNSLNKWGYTLGITPTSSFNSFQSGSTSPSVT